MICYETFLMQDLQSDLSFDVISLPLEFKIDSNLAIILSILIAIKIIQTILFQKESIKGLGSQQTKLYFSNHLISTFAIIGIVLSNNIFNLFIFIELYFISHFSLSISQKNSKVNNKNSQQIILSLASSMLFLISMIALYFNFETTNLSEIVLNIESSQGSSLVILSCYLILISLIIRFIPIWVFFSKNIKDSSAISNEIFCVLFINLNLLICLLLKTYYIIFSNTLITSIIVISCIVLAIYSSALMIFKKHIRSQMMLFCLATFCLLVLSLALKNQSSFMATFFYILNYNISILSIFFFVTFLWTRYSLSTIEDISALQSSDKFLSRTSHSLFLLIIFLSSPLPYSPIFYANFFLFEATLYNNADQLYEFSNFFDPYILITILLFHLASLVLFFRILASLISPAKDKYKSPKQESKSDSIIIYLTNLFMLLILIYTIFNIGHFQSIIEGFSNKLFNIL